MVGDVPYRLVFGQMPRVGISSLHLSPTVLDSLATEAQLNRVCDYVGKEPDATDDPVAADGEEDDPVLADVEEVEESAEATADLAVGEDEVEIVLGNTFTCPEITVDAVGVAIAEMVTAGAIEMDEDYVEEGKPDDEDGGEGEGVPVAVVVCDEVTVDAASDAGTMRCPRGRPRYRIFPLPSCLMLTFCGTYACACQYLSPGA